MPSPWFQTTETELCATCVQARHYLVARHLVIAGDLAIDLLNSSDAAALVKMVMTSLAVSLRPLRVSLLVPELGGNWRVSASSDRRESQDLMIATDLYPELLEVRRTGAPFFANPVDDATELRPHLAALAAAGMRSLAAFPLFLDPQSAEPAVLKLSFGRELDETEFALAMLCVHLLLHRLAALPEAEVAFRLGLSPQPAPVSGRDELLRLLPVAALVVDADGRVTHANARSRWLFRRAPAGDDAGPQRLSVIPARIWESAPRWEGEIAGPSGPQPVLGWSRRLDAGSTLVLLEINPEARRSLRDRRIRLAYDSKVAELETANRLLQEHAILRSRFVSDAAHELKTPLAILRSYLETLTTDLADGLSPEQNEFLQGATIGARRLQRLVEQLLDLAALDGGHLPIALGPVGAVEVARSVADTLRPLTPQSGVDLVVANGPAAIVRADPERLAQVLRNLIENGIKFTPAGGRVEVSFAVEADRGVITVSDTGIGIPEKLIGKIFDQFVRVGSKPTDGAGLGLAITRRLVMGMGGRIGVTSQPNEGSSFSVELPLWTAEQ